MEHTEAKQRSLNAEDKPRSIGFAETTVQAMKHRGIFIQGRGDFTAAVENEDAAFNVSSTYSFGAQVAEVEVDVETGQVKVHKFWASHDCGRAINPMSIEGQEEGSIVCGTGHTLYESRYVDDSGRMLTPSFLDYRIPTAIEAPEVEPHLVETIDPIGPFGAKGVSEGAQVPVAPAIANAIYDAIGVRIKDMPITPENILRALEEKRRKEAKDSENSK